MDIISHVNVELTTRRIISYPADVPCPGPFPSSDLFNHVCDICDFSNPDVYFSLLTYFFPSLFMRLLACSLLGW